MVKCQVSTLKLMVRKLDSLGYINSYYGVQNDPKRLSKLKNKLEFARPISAIDVAEVTYTLETQKMLQMRKSEIWNHQKAKLVEKYMDVLKLTHIFFLFYLDFLCST
jgi:hypothetical protein